MKAENERYTIAVDFDGVIHSYTSAWTAAHEIPDPPVEGAIEWLNRMAAKFTIVIHTTRGRVPEGRDAVRMYLLDNGFRTDVELPDVTSQKPPALVYIDDRAWRFTGTFPTAEEIHRARPWNKAVLDQPDRKDKRDVLLDLLRDPHHRATADSILNALHQEGWAVVPR